MYLLTPNEIRMIHEERIGELQNDQRKRKANQKPRKSLFTWLKRDEA